MNLPDFESEYSALFGAVRKVVPSSMKIYLVGGAVRDILLGRKIRDFDFTVEGLVRPIGKHIANELGGAYYVLDDEREMVRVIIEDDKIGKYDVDIAQFTGDTIEDDLKERDFTFNAMAIEIGKEPVFIDPFNGYFDLQNKILKMCASDSLKNDPLRAMRAIRMSLEFDLQMDEELVSAILNERSNFSFPSMERYRDELFKIIRIHRNDVAVKQFQQFGLLDHLFPDRKQLQNDAAGFISNTDYFSLLLTIDKEFLELKNDFDKYAVSRLGNYKESLKAFFEKPLALYHNRRMLNLYTAIVSVFSDDPEKIRSWCSRLAFSSSEVDFVMESLNSFKYLMSIDNPASHNDVDIYRYFRKYKEGGIGGLLLYLANGYKFQNVANAFQKWCDRIVFVEDIIAAYFSRYMEVVSPKPMMSGYDIQKILDIPAGPAIGQIKNSLIEAQIRGSVKTVSEAELFVRQEAKHYH